MKAGLYDGHADTNTVPFPTEGGAGHTFTFYSGATSTITVTGSIVTIINLPATLNPATYICPPDDAIV